MMRHVSQFEKTFGMASLVGLWLFLSAPGPASAGVALLVNDWYEAPLALHLVTSGSTTIDNSSIQITQEGIGILGAADAHFEYTTSDPNAPVPGQTLTYNFNIYEDSAHTVLSDTWSIVITGHTPTGTDTANVSLDTHFRSDSLDEVSPPALVNATAITEIPYLPPPSGMPDGTYQYVGPLLSDLTTGFNSSVPEPSSWLLLGTGSLAGIFFVRRRR